MRKFPEKDPNCMGVYNFSDGTFYIIAGNLPVIEGEIIDVYNKRVDKIAHFRIKKLKEQ